MKFQVFFSHYTERHFIKSFSKKYPGAWDKTLKSLFIEFAFVHLLFEKQIAEIISVSADNSIKIGKTEFKILGTDVSRHASGNSCIIAINESARTVTVLLVYHKSDIVKSGGETAAWKKIIQENFQEFSAVLN